MATRTYISEGELVTGLRNRERAAIEYLYDHYSSALFGVIIRIVQKQEVAEEVLQDMFLKIWDKFHNYDAAKGKLFTWMVNIARNQAIDKTRSKEVNKEKKTRGLENSVNAIDRQNIVEQRSDHIGIKELLRNLQEEQRFIVEYLYLKGYTQLEISEEFNIPLGTVKTRLRLGMQKLRASLGIK